jgi:tetratricopeptide (TPR) repeat protein
MKLALLDEADRALAERRHREAIEAYGRVRGIDGENARARDGLERARRDFDRAQELGRAAWERLARVAEKIEEYDRRLLLPHEDYKPEAAAALLAAARRLVDENLALEEIVDRAVAARSRQRLAQVESREGRHRAALAALERAIALDPSPELVFQRGLVRLGVYRADVAAMRGSDIAPHMKEGIPLLEPVRKAALEDIQAGVTAGVASGRELEYARASLEYAQNDFAQALARLTALEGEPESRVWKLKGDVLLAMDEREKAIAAYEKGALVTRSDYEAHFGLGNAWFLMAKRDRREIARFREFTTKAHEAFSIAIRLKPSLAALYSARGQLASFLVERGMLNRTITEEEVVAGAADLEKAIALEESDVDSRRALATLYVQTGLGRILERKLGDAREMERRLDRALAVLDEAIARSPSLVKLHRDRGAARVIKGLLFQVTKREPLAEFQGGLKELEETTAAAPADNDTVQFMAFAYLFSAIYKLGKFQDPRPDFEGAVGATTKAIEQSTGDSRARASAARGLCRILYGFYYHFFGKRAEAAAQLEACVEDLRVARSTLEEFAAVREEPVALFVKAIKLQVANEDATAAFAEAAKLFTESLDQPWPNGRVEFIVRTFFKLMRGFCYFYTEQWKEADADWRELVEKFPPAAPMLGPKLKEIEKRLKGDVPP